MTAPAPRPGPDVATSLAEALCKVLGIDRSDTDEASLQEVVAALLPVVDEVARQRAADELDAAAAEVRDNHGTASLSAKRIDARAAALLDLATAALTGEEPS